MWPMRSEMTRDECRKCLRYLELDAYGSMVSVLRAQGPFTSEKQKLLQELAKMLHISNERHRAEVRRAVNDEKLATIAEQFNGPNTGTDWAIEGRRTIPLLPRLKARSAFTILANSLSLATTAANEKKLDRCVILGRSENSTAIETESQLEVKIDEDLSLDAKLCSVDNDLNSSKILHENSDLAEEEKIDDKDMVDKVVDKPKVLKFPEKRKSPPLPTAPPNKVLVVSKPLNISWTHENKQTSQISHASPTMHHQNVAFIPCTIDEISDSKESMTVSEHSSGCVAVPLNKHVITTIISTCTSNVSNPKMVTSTVQNKVSTKVVPAVSSSVLCMSLNKVHSENKDAQPQDNASNTQKTQGPENSSLNPSCKMRSMASIIHDAIVSSPSHRLTNAVTVYPSTTVSSGPGPPQSKQAPITLMPKKLPSEHIANHQSTAKTGVTINSKKVVNMPPYPNAKLNTKTNVIVIQKGHAKGVTLSHAGKEVLGKVIMGGKNLCVTSQHNASSISVQPHHISLNNGDQMKTVLSTTNSPQNAECVKTNIKSGNAAVMSVVTTGLRHDVSDKDKVLLQFFDSLRSLNSESKTVIARLGECDSDAHTNDRESSLKTESAITSMTEEKQHRKTKDVNASMNSQLINPLDSSKSLESKEIHVRTKQIATTQDADAGDNNIRIEKPKDMDAFGTMLDSTDTEQSFQCPVNNDENREESLRSITVINQTDERDS